MSTLDTPAARELPPNEQSAVCGLAWSVLGAVLVLVATQSMVAHVDYWSRSPAYLRPALVTAAIGLLTILYGCYRLRRARVGVPLPRLPSTEAGRGIAWTMVGSLGMKCCLSRTCWL